MIEMLWGSAPNFGGRGILSRGMYDQAHPQDDCPTDRQAGTGGGKRLASVMTKLHRGA